MDLDLTTEMDITDPMIENTPMIRMAPTQDHHETTKGNLNFKLTTQYYSDVSVLNGISVKRCCQS